MGDSSHGPIGLCAQIVAESEERAVEILKDALPDMMEVTPWEDPRPGEKIEYINVYMNPDAVTRGDIMESWAVEGEGEEQEFALETTLRAIVRVRAKTREEAESMLESAGDCISPKLELAPGVRVSEMSVDAVWPPTCILTGAPGEDPDDCTTHEHESHTTRTTEGDK